MRTIVSFKSLLIVSSLIIAFTSCEKSQQVTFPATANNYGENIFALPSGSEFNPTELIKGESYSLEANLTKKASLRAVFTNTTPDDDATYYRWLFTYAEGWYADNYVDKKQEFTTSTAGNNDLKIVFQGDSGQCRLDVYDNGGAEPAIVKFFSW